MGSLLWSIHSLFNNNQQKRFMRVRTYVKCAAFMCKCAFDFTEQVNLVLKEMLALPFGGRSLVEKR